MIVRAELPVGCGVGTTAATAVALAGALATFAGGDLPPHYLATLAHRINSEELGRMCGMQSYLASALGGITLYRFDPYPRAFVTPVPLSQHTVTELERRLLLVRTGRKPRRDFYAHLTRRYLTGGRVSREVIWRLRTLPVRAMDALRMEDFLTLGEIMTEHTQLQQRLCPSINCPEVWRITDIAREFGILAAKTNGTGGSVTILCPPEGSKPVMSALRQVGYSVMPVRIDREGLRVWTEGPEEIPLPTSRPLVARAA